MCVCLTSSRYDAMSFLCIISSLVELEESSSRSDLSFELFSLEAFATDRTVCRSSLTSLAKVVTNIAISCENSALSASLIFDVLPIKLLFKG